MRKGEFTRQNIVKAAVHLASRVGLEGLSIGRLAQQLDLSKSGLYAHFQSKEALEIATIEFAAERLVDKVVRPALKAPRGEPRVRALFDNWLSWSHRQDMPGGCLFYALTSELDDRPGATRDRLVRSQKDWRDMIANCVAVGIEEGHFRADTDPQQFAHELYGVYLSGQFAQRLMQEPDAEARMRSAFESLLDSVRAPGPRAKAN